MSPEPAEKNKILLYTSPEGKKKVEVVFQDENCWLTQKAMAELFGVQRPAITKHLKNIIESGELKEDSVSSILEHTADDGKIYATRYYNLDAIIAVGYRVNSYQATQFRIWATQTLKEFILKGFVLDDERLRPKSKVWPYFIIHNSALIIAPTSFNRHNCFPTGGLRVRVRMFKAWM